MEKHEPISERMTLELTEKMLKMLFVEVLEQMVETGIKLIYIKRIKKNERTQKAYMGSNIKWIRINFKNYG